MISNASVHYLCVLLAQPHGMWSYILKMCLLCYDRRASNLSSWIWITDVLVLHFCSVHGQRGQRCSYVLSPSAASSLGVSFNLLEPLTQAKLWFVASTKKRVSQLTRMKLRWRFYWGQEKERCPERKTQVWAWTLQEEVLISAMHNLWVTPRRCPTGAKKSSLFYCSLSVLITKIVTWLQRCLGWDYIGLYSADVKRWTTSITQGV